MKRKGNEKKRKEKYKKIFQIIDLELKKIVSLRWGKKLPFVSRLSIRYRHPIIGYRFCVTDI